MSEPAATAPTPQDDASVAEDFVDIFVAPARVFARRAKANPMVPYLVVCVVMIALFFASRNVLAPIFDAQIQQQMQAQMKANPQLTQDMIDRSKPITNVIITVAGVVGVPIILLIIALVTFIVGRFFMGGAFSFGTALLITSFSWFPRLVSSVLGLVEGLTMDVSKMTSPYQLSLGLARLFDPSTMSNGLYQLLGQVDLFSIWATVLVIIGLMHAGKLDRGKATATGVIMYVVGAIPAILAVIMGK